MKNGIINEIALGSNDGLSPNLSRKTRLSAKEITKDADNVGPLTQKDPIPDILNRNQKKKIGLKSKPKIKYQTSSTIDKVDISKGRHNSLPSLPKISDQFKEAVEYISTFNNRPIIESNFGDINLPILLKLTQALLHQPLSESNLNSDWLYSLYNYLKPKVKEYNKNEIKKILGIVEDLNRGRRSSSG